jgi:hypothetical protein
MEWTLLDRLSRELRFLVALVALTPLAIGCDDPSTRADAGRQIADSHAAAELGLDLRPADAPPTDRSFVDGLAPDQYAPPAVIDASTMTHKVLYGYQGWFACPGDGSTLDAWVHWFSKQSPSAANATFDCWPDVSELTSAERCATSMTTAGGQPAAVYSAYRKQTVVRHMAWMRKHDIDGVFLQRFVSELGSPKHKAFRDQVARNIRDGAAQHGRVFALMYDISGYSGTNLLGSLQADWKHLVDTLQLTGSPRYLKHNARPVLAIWGLGFSDRPTTAAQAQQIVDWFKSGAAPKYRAWLVGGVPTHWRTLNGDAKTNPAWAKVYTTFDVISPWAVGRYGTLAGADSFKSKQIVPDMATLKGTNVAYMPVVFPGFSWANLKPGALLNQIPRLGGAFYWRQAYNAISAGATMLYVAMFDEVDEGTAMFKLAPTKAELPLQGQFVPLNIDGQKLPADWYLRLGGETSRMMRGVAPLTTTIPITP